MQQIVLFLDIDGVINVPDSSPPQLLSRHWRGTTEGMYGFPVLLARQFLQAVEQAEWIKPIWLSSGWRQNANAWNDWAQTKHWRVGYPLSFAQTRGVMATYPKMDLENLDGKIISALWHSGNSPRVVWIEDGFKETAIAWAKQDNRVTLINTLHRSDSTRNGIQSWNIDEIQASLNLKLSSTPQFESC